MLYIRVIEFRSNDESNDFASWLRVTRCAAKRRVIASDACQRRVVLHINAIDRGTADILVGTLVHEFHELQLRSRRHETDRHDAAWLVRELRAGATREFRRGCARTAREAVRAAHAVSEYMETTISGA